MIVFGKIEVMIKIITDKRHFLLFTSRIILRNNLFLYLT